MALPPAGDHSTCLVTGASSGLGSEIARQLARRGRGVTLVARREPLLHGLAEELASTGVRVEVLPADLTDADARAALAKEVEARGLLVEVLVNNAGFSTVGPVRLADRDRELAMVRTDVEAVVDLCTLFVPAMASRRRGAVLNTASTAGFQPLPGQAGYSASKAFVLSYTQALRAELHPLGVTVTALCPGPVETGFAEVAGFSEDEATAALPKFLWVAAPEVARAAVDGLEKDKAVVIPGLGNRVGAMAGHLAPRRLLTPIVARQHPGMRRSR